MKIMTIALIALMLICFTGCEKTTKPVNPEAEKAAVEAAKAWLAIVDTEEYGQSWAQTAEFFQKAVTQETWEQKTQAFRNPLGKCIDRKLKDAAYTTTVPGAPDGEYVIIQFDSSFENKKTAVETVTPMKGKEEKWKVSGYFIK